MNTSGKQNERIAKMTVASVYPYYLEKVKNLIFQKINAFEPTVGDKVYSLNWTEVPNGKYRYSLFKSYIVNNGRIIE